MLESKLIAQLTAKLTAEFIGTFVLVFFGCGSVMVADRFPGSVSLMAIPVVFGLTVAAMIYAVGHISGAHFNPAVTLGFALAKHFPKNQVIVYWLAQFTGALAASSCLYLILPKGDSYGATVLSVSIAQGFVWECILSFFLMFVIISVATDARAVGTMAGAAIGFTVLVCAAVGGPITGASMNPARSFAPNLFEGQLSILWVYALAPCVGAALAAFAYNRIRCLDPRLDSDLEPKKSEVTDAQGCC